MCCLGKKFVFFPVSCGLKPAETFFSSEKTLFISEIIQLKGGGKMDKDSKRARIQAAREWLGQADDSLERSDEMQGDLKLMLAKAELEGAAPGKAARRLHKWLARGAALAAAVLIALAIENWPFGREMVQEDIPAPAPAQTAEEMPLGEQLAGEKQRESAVVEEPSLPPEEPAGKAAPSPPTQENLEVREGTFEAGTPQSAASPHLTYSPPSVPSPDKQKLMQEAGAVLRH